MSNSVTLSYDPTWQALEWAKQHCASYITHTITRENRDWFHGKNYSSSIMCVTYYFSNERDATMFRLHWA